jgi:spore maturation protein CgeB
MSATVLLVGNADVEMGLTASYKRAFEALGHKVVPFNIEEARDQAAPPSLIGKRLMAHLDFFALSAKANRSLARVAMQLKPDLVIVMCNAFVRAATLLHIKTALPGTALINIFPDTVHNLHDYVLSALPLYDLFCTHTKAALPSLRQLGCRAPFYLPLAADPFLYGPVELSADDQKTFACDIVYVGTWRPEHEELLEALEGLDLAVWGSNYWRRHTRRNGWVRSRYRGRSLTSGADYAKAHRVAKVVLNPIDPLNFPSHNQRVFEVPACGAFSLASRTTEVQELFVEGETIACFEGVVEMVEKVRYYLAHPKERQLIAEQAYDFVVNRGHTYTDRARSILLELNLPN